MTDARTAGFYPFEPAVPGRVATRIVNEVEGINRVDDDFTNKPPRAIEREWSTPVIPSSQGPPVPIENSNVTVCDEFNLGT